MSKPVIGISLDFEASGSFSKRAHYALRCAYFEMISAAGGLPVAIPYHEVAIDGYLDLIDGLCMPGGDYAFPEAWYMPQGEVSPFQSGPRCAFDITLMRAVLERDMPVLGICAGMQIMAGVSGCRLTSDITEHYTTTIDHLNEQPAESYAHSVTLVPNTALHRAIKQEQIDVNTAHREAVHTVSDTVRVSATAPDGVVEAIEVVNKQFALGVQWHPEFFIESDTQRAIAEALVIEAGKGTLCV